MGLSTNALSRAFTTMTQNFNAAGEEMARSLERISSQSRINRPSDDFSGFSKVAALSTEVTTYENNAATLREKEAITKQALDIANQIMSDLTKMGEAVGAGETEIAAGYGNSVIQSRGLQSHNNANLITAGFTAAHALTGADGTALTITTAAITDLTAIAVDSDATEIADAKTATETYISELTGIQNALKSQIKIADVMAQNSKSVSKAITQIDEAEELANFVEADIRQQAAVSMFTQANISRRNIESIYK